MKSVKRNIVSRKKIGMYETIELIIFQKKLSKKVIAQNLQIGYNTFLLKLLLIVLIVSAFAV